MRKLGLVLVALCGSVLGCGGGSSKAKGDLSVAGTPTGEITGQMRIVLAFSRPMVGKDQLARPVPSVPFTLSPALAGTATWVVRASRHEASGCDPGARRRGRWCRS